MYAYSVHQDLVLTNRIRESVTQNVFNCFCSMNTYHTTFFLKSFKLNFTPVWVNWQENKFWNFSLGENVPYSAHTCMYIVIVHRGIFVLYKFVTYF